jgi:hypothetical protein
LKPFLQIRNLVAADSRSNDFDIHPLMFFVKTVLDERHIAIRLHAELGNRIPKENYSLSCVKKMLTRGAPG